MRVRQEKEAISCKATLHSQWSERHSNDRPYKDAKPLYRSAFCDPILQRLRTLNRLEHSLLHRVCGAHRYNLGFASLPQINLWPRSNSNSEPKVWRLHGIVTLLQAWVRNTTGPSILCWDNAFDECLQEQLPLFRSVRVRNYVLLLASRL